VTSAVGWIGLGSIGLPMAQRLLGAGHALHTWARRRDAAAPLLQAGATWHDDPATLAAACDSVFTCVGGPDDVAELQRRLMPRARAGTLFVDCSTAAPRTGQDAERLASDVGVLALDAPVTGGVAGAQRGTLTTFIGGSAAAAARAQPLLATFCQRQVHAGGAGSGYRLKLVNQALMAGSLLAVADAAAWARAAGLDGAQLHDALAGGSGGSFIFNAYWPRMLASDGPASFSLGLLRKDLRLARAEAASLGTPTRLLDAALAAVEAACTRHGPEAGVQRLAAA
jgi:3-hydroxyisobutyrate dehydrogenase-like beta-hydroxyacid dehydrogenase